MKIRISAKDFSLTPSIREFLTERFERLSHYRTDILDAIVTLNVERHHTKGEKFIADARIRIPGKDVFSFVRANDMRTAIDELAEKLSRQLRRGKERQLTERRKR